MNRDSQSPDRFGPAWAGALAARLSAAVRAHGWRETALAGLGITLIAMLPLLVNGRFYFNDDYQSYFLPVFREIARLLTAGEFPLATPRLWFGGAIAAEYQYAVFHPVCLFLYLVLYPIGNLVVAATLYSLIHIFLLGTGVYALCRHLGCTPASAFLGGLIACTSSWLLYWGASNWIPALVSQAWMVWAVYFLLLAGRSARWFLPAALAVALTLLSGWPFGNLAFLLALAVLGAVALGTGARADGVWRSGLAVLSGSLLAMPAILSVAGFISESGRVLEYRYLGSMTLNGFFSFGVPSAVDQWTSTGQRVSTNLGVQSLYASWTIPVALAAGGWAVLWREKRGGLLAVILLAVIFGIAAMLPGFWQFRWFFRILPFYHMALGVLAALLLSHVRFTPERRKPLFLLCALAVLVPFIIPVSLDSGTFRLTAVFMGALGAGLYVLFKAAAHGETAFRTALIGGHIFILLLMALVWPRNLVVPRWDYPAAGPPPGVEREDTPRRLALYRSYSHAEDEADDSYWSHIAIANTAAYLDAHTINGYTPTEQRGLKKLFCFDAKGGMCRDGDGARHVFAPVWNGLNLLDLAGVEEVATENPQDAEIFRQRAGAEWEVKSSNGPYTVFMRNRQLPGFALAAPGDGLSVRQLSGPPGPSVFRLRARPEFAGGEMVIRRPWYPGIHARLDGRPIKVETIERALPLIRIPPGAQGRLVVGYWPKGLTAGLWLAAAGLIILAAALIRPARLLAPPGPFVGVWRFLTSRAARLLADWGP